MEYLAHSCVIAEKKKNTVKMICYLTNKYFYINSNKEIGNDENGDGSEGRPFLTLSRAYEALDTIRRQIDLLNRK